MFLYMTWSAVADCFGFMVGHTHNFFCMGWFAAAECFDFMVGDNYKFLQWVGLQLQIVLDS